MGDIEIGHGRQRDLSWATKRFVVGDKENVQTKCTSMAIDDGIHKKLPLQRMYD